MGVHRSYGKEEGVRNNSMVRRISWVECIGRKEKGEGLSREVKEIFCSNSLRRGRNSPRERGRNVVGIHRTEEGIWHESTGKKNKLVSVHRDIWEGEGA